MKWSKEPPNKYGYYWEKYLNEEPCIECYRIRTDGTLEYWEDGSWFAPHLDVGDYQWSFIPWPEN